MGLTSAAFPLKQFLHGIDKSGLAHGLLFNVRFESDETLKPDRIFNRPGFGHIPQRHEAKFPWRAQPPGKRKMLRDKPSTSIGQTLDRRSSRFALYAKARFLSEKKKPGF